jgi:hypothetical protein
LAPQPEGASSAAVQIGQRNPPKVYSPLGDFFVLSDMKQFMIETYDGEDMIHAICSHGYGTKT